jgi:hypothetical protein
MRIPVNPAQFGWGTFPDGLVLTASSLYDNWSYIILWHYLTIFQISSTHFVFGSQPQDKNHEIVSGRSTYKPGPASILFSYDF